MSPSHILQPPSRLDAGREGTEAPPGASNEHRNGPATAGPARRLLRDSSIYLLGNLLQKATAFILIPLYTNALTTAQYGLLELANTVVNLLLLVVALGVPSAINKCYHRDCTDEAARRRLAGTALWFTIGVTGVMALAAWSLEGRLAGILFTGPEGALVYRYTLLWVVLAQLSVIPFEWVRAAGRPHLYVGLSLIQLSVQFASIVLLVRGWDLGLSGVLAGNVLGLVAVNLVGGALLAPKLALTIDRRLLKAMASFGLAMTPVFLSSWIVNVSDRFFVQSMVGLGALGIYSLGYKFGAIVDLLIVMPFQRAWTPIFFQMAGEPGAPIALARVTTYLAGGLCLASLAVSLGVPPLLRLIASADFQGASGVVPLICLAYLIGGLANCLGNGLIVAGRVRLIAAYAALAALSNLALNALLIPRMGVYGAAVATVLAFAVQLGAILASLARHYPVPLEWRRMGGLGLCCLLPFMASCALPSLPVGLDIAARLALLALSPALIVAFRLMPPEDAAAIRRRLAAWRVLRSASDPVAPRVAPRGPGA